jgi:hypothetical protein
LWTLKSGASILLAIEKDSGASILLAIEKGLPFVDVILANIPAGLE